MDASTLASLMLDYETAQRQADALRAEIEAAVLALGKTQTVGNVRATFSAGRRTFDYEAAIDKALDAGAVDPKDMAAFEYLDTDYFSVVESAIAGGLLSGEYLDPYTKIKTDYASAVKALGLEAPVLEQKPASVTVKLLA
jgi:hypothetical protein